nr:FeoB-associated Cys-rich membrane protein [Neobacillus muris]
MISSIIIGIAVFGYASWALVKFIQKSKQGKCAACEINKSCSKECCIPKQVK